MNKFLQFSRETTNHAHKGRIIRFPSFVVKRFNEWRYGELDSAQLAIHIRKLEVARRVLSVPRSDVAMHVGEVITSLTAAIVARGDEELLQNEVANLHPPTDQAHIQGVKTIYFRGN